MAVSSREEVAATPAPPKGGRRTRLIAQGPRPPPLPGPAAGSPPTLVPGHTHTTPEEGGASTCVWESSQHPGSTVAPPPRTREAVTDNRTPCPGPRRAPPQSRATVRFWPVRERHGHPARTLTAAATARRCPTCAEASSAFRETLGWGASERCSQLPRLQHAHLARSQGPHAHTRVYMQLHRTITPAHTRHGSHTRAPAHL